MQPPDTTAVYCILYTQLILVTTDAKFLLILAHFDQFLAITLGICVLFGVLSTGLDNVVVYQN